MQSKKHNQLEKDIIPLDRLEFELNSKEPELYKRFVDIRKRYFENVVARQQKSDDTDSSLKHYANVQRNINRLIPPGKIVNLNSIELFVILVATNLHDIGKTQQKKVRGEHHATTGRKLLEENAQILRLEDSEALSIGYVIEGHGIIDIGQLHPVRAVVPYGTIRIRYLAALLRLADDLDMGFDRAPLIAQEIVKPNSDIIGKWRFRRSVEDVVIDPESWSIVVLATPRSDEDNTVLLREIDIVRARLIDGRKYLKETPEIGLYYSVIDENYAAPHFCNKCLRYDYLSRLTVEGGSNGSEST